MFGHYLKAGLVTSIIGLSSSLALAEETPDVPRAEAEVERAQGKMATAEKKSIKANNAFIETFNKYYDDSTQANYDALVTAEKNDEQAIQEVVNATTQYRQAQEALSKAKAIYYQDTPATIDEITKGPDPKTGAISEAGESIAKRQNEDLKTEVIELSKEIESSGGNESSFAKALREQAAKLKNVKDRVEVESKDPAIGSKPQKEDTDLAKILQRALDARRLALEEEQANAAKKQQTKAPGPQNTKKPGH